MSEPSPDLLVYSPDNLIAQAAVAPDRLGYKLVRFYVDEKGLLAKSATEHIGTFYLSPSGGTLRDMELNIVLYSAKFDIYKGLGRVS
ncbi:MAG: hypothetical protein IPH85_04820 [Ignavibacteria bacterium]|nr:hypothetical protein [Ignavibacteria bacterium]MBK7576104.1 hypothetical protein [Ignavibacteria bacterium]MBK9182448.1 hypothetical protein [Ignavibacteria bacterium]